MWDRAVNRRDRSSGGWPTPSGWPMRFASVFDSSRTTGCVIVAVKLLATVRPGRPDDIRIALS